jgi:DNA-binding LacI/PurR family transcriptional regulator
LSDTSGGRRRLDAYIAEQGAAYEPSMVARGDYGRASGAAALTELLGRHPDLDAVFAANDMMAAGAIATLMDPQLTTMRQPFGRISEEMVRLLLRVIDGDRPATIILPTDLVIRASA